VAGVEATAHCTILRGGSGSFALFAGEPLFVVGWAVDAQVAIRPCGAGLAGFPVPHIATRDWRLEAGGLREMRPASSLQSQGGIVSHDTIDELIARWKKEELTVEQAVGQILLALKELERKVKEVARGAPADAGKATRPRRER